MGHRAVVAESSRRELHLPRPGAAALPLLVLALVAVALDAAPELPWTVGVGVASVFVAAAGVRALQRYLELRRLRATADRLIRRDDVRIPRSAFIDWRTQELTSSGHRHALARTLGRLVRELDPSALPGASPLNRRAARPKRERFVELAALLDDPTRAVSARGVLEVESLLTEPGSPLYDRRLAARLEGALGHALATLASVSSSTGRRP